jgi:uncharacterized protein YhfF
MDFDGTDDELTSTTVPFSGTTHRTSFTISNADTATSADIIYGIDGGTASAPAGELWQLTSESAVRVSGKIEFENSAQTQRSLAAVVFNGTTTSNINLYLDGTLTTQTGSTSTTINTGSTNFGIGTTPVTTNNYDGIMQELIFYGSDKSSVRTSIEENIGDYFTQNTPLLDTYSGAAAAYSLRLLDSTYTGALINVWNGTSYADIYPNVFGELDTVALAAHCGSNDGFIRYWYDQSSNGNTAAQTTTANMPKIYDGTTGVVTENGKPAVEFDGSDDELTSTTVPFSGTTHRTSFTVSNADTATSADIIYGIDGGNASAPTGELWQLTSETQLRVSGRIEFNNSAQTIHSLGTLIFNGTTVDDANFYLNGSLTTQGTSTGATINTGSTNFGIGTTVVSTSNYDGKIQELIFYASDQSANRSNIEDNINTFYSIY